MTATGWPAMTMGEIRAGLEDEAAGRHWGAGVWCWCEEVHGDGEARLVPPPWVTETGDGNA